MDKRVLNILIGLGFGVIAVMVILSQFDRVNRRLARAIREGQAVRVVVATRDIPRETTITSDMIAQDVANKGEFQRGDLTNPQSVIGKMADVDILRGQHINRSMLRSIENFRYLSQRVPNGMRAMTIPVDQISAIEGLIKPGDKVDIVGSFGLPTGGGETALAVVNLFQGVKVLATNRNISPYQVTGEAGTITLALKPEDVKVLTFSLKAGEIRLVLRSPLDTSEEYGYSAVTYDTLMMKLGMWAPQPQQEEPNTVEVYEGTTRKDVPMP
ncbi:MAG: Flp pilus assembly protein CpaB [Candidatus Omnitrophica bacterium]|nr:Flp pilus assembly protein CpaB [Candidatus Omnitrophota bacterium]